MSNNNDKPAYEGEYSGVRFRLGKDFRFEVPEMDKRFDSYRDMSCAIKDFVSANEAATRKKLSLPAINSKGKTCVVTGVHAGHGNLTTKPNIESSRGSVYPNIGWIPDAVKRLRESERQTDRLRQLLSVVELKPYDGYGFRAAMHAEAVDRVEAQFANARKLVDTKSLEQALEKIEARELVLD